MLLASILLSRANRLNADLPAPECGLEASAEASAFGLRGLGARIFTRLEQGRAKLAHGSRGVFGLSGLPECEQ
jgi:hypothetical protein